MEYCVAITTLAGNILESKGVILPFSFPPKHSNIFLIEAPEVIQAATLR